MIRVAVLPLLFGLGLVQPAQALDFHPTQSVTLNWIEPGIFQFDNFTIPVGVTVALPGVEAGLTAPKVYFAIAGDVLLEGSLLARGWDVSMNFNGSFVSAPSSLIQSHSLVLNSLGSGQLQLGGTIIVEASTALTTPTDTLGDRTTDTTGNAGGITLQARGDVAIVDPFIAGAVISAGTGGEILLRPGSEIALVQSRNTPVYGNESLTLSAPIPEPKTYAMLLAGLGLVGYVVRKRV